jgi:ubiquinone/menaquinone biosynthesis C-methylase UbiE
MKTDQRALFDKTLRRARLSAYAQGQYVEQESFMGGQEIRDLARRAGIGPGVRVLDLCCGVAGPGRLITRTTGCDYRGLDLSESALTIARDRAGDLPCSFEVRKVPPLPDGRFDVVLLLETFLAFRDKEPLLLEIARVLPPRGRFAFTLEEGAPLTEPERARMPEADTVWLTPPDEMLALLHSTGFTVTWQLEVSQAHSANAASLIKAFAYDREAIAAAIGPEAIDELIAGHQLWREWLDRGRVRKFAMVAERTVSPPGPFTRR